MNRGLLLSALLVAVLAAGCASQQTRPLAAADDPMLAHDVYFTLKDNSDAAQQKLTDSCYELLADIPGIVFFTAGPRVKRFIRPVNIIDFDVGLHIVFENKKAHDAYQSCEKHQQFLNQNKAALRRVRVYDCYVR
ncbi:MAG: Dabb family protein [Planctomycetota bacterium]|jgi:hypothetical protein